ncbi:MAG: response regulator [Deltaproteobacteria bacterium]|nr:response regulator [Deltaproteobacteria bacterium]
MAAILVVDDSSFARKATMKIVSLLGYDTLAADGGEECLKMARDYSPSCILLDLLMPGMSGVEILKKLQQDHGDIPVIIQTADIQESVRKECLKLGARAFLNKPPRSDELAQAIEKALAKDN